MIVAPREFRDEKFEEPKTILEREGIKVVVASTASGTARGMFGMQITPDITIEEVNPAEFDAVLIVGGLGSQTYLWDNSGVQRIVRYLNQRERLVGAICIFPVVLAKAGLLKGKKATVFRTAATINELEKGGAIISHDPVVVDGKIVTGRGPEAAREFGQKIAENLSQP